MAMTEDFAAKRHQNTFTRMPTKPVVDAKINHWSSFQGVTLVGKSLFIRSTCLCVKRNVLAFYQCPSACNHANSGPHACRSWPVGKRATMNISEIQKPISTFVGQTALIDDMVISWGTMTRSEVNNITDALLRTIFVGVP